MVNRKKEDFTRVSKNESPNKIFVISVEGASDEPSYFEALNNIYKINIRFEYVITSPNDDDTCTGTKSAPNHVIRRLKKKIETIETFDLKKGDQAWLVMDRDKWGGILYSTIQEAHINHFNLAISNISFNTWLYMHDNDWICTNAPDCCSKKCKKCSQNILKKDFDSIVSNVRNAVDRAKKCETSASENSETEIPPCPGSRVYKLIEELGIL